MHKITWQKICGVIAGNLILGFGGALLKVSGMGNDPFCAANMSLSENLNIGLGTFQLAVNIVLLIIQLIWGRKYLGFGSIVNLFGLGYIIQYSEIAIRSFPGSDQHFTLFQQFIMMAIALIILTFGLAMYQTASLGVAPYDYLAMGMSDALPTPYFVNRVITDTICVVIILISVLTGIATWNTSHLGIGTVLCAFCLGPLVEAFSRLHQKWIH